MLVLPGESKSLFAEFKDDEDGFVRARARMV
jgi:hypothetical protein